MYNKFQFDSNQGVTGGLNYPISITVRAKLIVCTPPPSPFLLGGGGGGVEQPTKFLKWERGLTGPQLLEGVTFFRRGWCNFHIKNKLKCEISSDKKSLWAKKNFN